MINSIQQAATYAYDCLPTKETTAVALKTMVTTAVAMEALANLSGAEAGPITYAACVASCAFAAPPVVPFCLAACAPSLGPWCP